MLLGFDIRRVFRGYTNMAWVNLNELYVPREQYETDMSELRDLTSEDIPFVDPFVGYGAGVLSGGTFKAFKIGNVVTLAGAASVNQAITLSTTEQTMATLPTQYRPEEALRTIMQGSTANKWLFIINPDGVMTASRYGTDTWQQLTAQTASRAGTWLPFSVTYVTG